MSIEFGEICPAPMYHMKEFWYIAGALLGDGYVSGSGGKHLVGLDVRDGRFAEKFAIRMSSLLGKAIRAHYYGGNRIWFVRTNEEQLFNLLKRLREKPDEVLGFVDSNKTANGLGFIEGLFDAEGCVKVIKEQVRKTPKICLDFTNTRLDILTVANEVMQRTLGLAGRYSSQVDTRSNRKPSIHLRLYQKAAVARFLRNIDTVKLTDQKRAYVSRWLALNADRVSHGL